MRIGIDLGGNKIEAILLDASGRELARNRRATPQGDYKATLHVITEMVREIEREFATKATVGVGIPGTISSATKLVKNANSVWLIGHPLEQDLARELERPVRIANDADCFTISEATDGAAAGTRFVFGVILGTGVGGGICWRGNLLEGQNGITGEWGHNPLPWPTSEEHPGADCYCGRTGCIETFLSGPGLSRDFRSAGGPDISAQEICVLASGGHALAEESVSRYENRLARGLASVINLLDPDIIVLGGGLSNLTRLYDRVPQLWSGWIFSDRVDTRIVPPVFGDSSGVRGAAWLWGLDAS